MHPEIHGKRMNIHVMHAYTKRKIREYYRWYTGCNKLTNRIDNFVN